MIVFVCAVLGLGVALFAGRVAFRVNPFHPMFWFAAFAAIDAFVPAISWSLFDYPIGPEWMPRLTESDVSVGLTYYTAYLILFLAALVFAGGNMRAAISGAAPSKNRIRTYCAALWVLLGLVMLEMLSNISQSGGIDAWLSDQLVLSGARVTGEAVNSDFFSIVKPQAVFFSMVGVLYRYRTRTRWGVVYGFVVPAIAILLALMTTYRGTVLSVIFTLIFAEYMRIMSGEDRAAKSRALKKLTKLVMVAVIGVVLVMYTYATFRDEYRTLAANETLAIGATTNPLTVGHGLQGIAHVIAEYGENVDFLGGKTYLDMALMLVPRSIYTTKPAWYGIDDITRRMGWPETTMTAVTMPGEAYANFGVSGLLVAIPFGLIFGLLFRLTKISELHYLALIPILTFQMVSTTNWMSFTGFMNSLVSMIVICIVIEIVRPRERRTRTGAAPRRPLFSQPNSRGNHEY